MIDLFSFLLGVKKGNGTVDITNGVTCTDDGEGNITITEEADDNG